MHIVFVCTGNTCRSPMAAHLLRQVVEQRGLDWVVESAGLYALAGSPMNEQAARVLRRRGITDTTHQAQPVDERLVKEADLILTMTRQHAEELCRRHPHACGKVHALPQFAGWPELEIADPFGGDETVYDRCADEIERYLQVLVEKLAPGEKTTGADSEEKFDENCDCE
ncbi:low molecular weight protein arginine phosphatase [Alicyclobacillus herbarius]|uniref:low molecular weight protein arginine phosphatase n=1 Tax=Alicyclobacillus herbarius TaxID=122960 RepID=UPI000408BFAB|nr:low molecular weight protein arginine phosphatase [Alicyclobacillus herbarius]